MLAPNCLSQQAESAIEPRVRKPNSGSILELVNPTMSPRSQLSIWVLIEGIAARRRSKNAVSVGLLADLRQATHRGIRSDFGVIGRMVTWGRCKLRTQRGMSDTPSPLSTKVITVAMKLGSFTMRGEKPVRRQFAMTSSKRRARPCGGTARTAQRRDFSAG